MHAFLKTGTLSAGDKDAQGTSDGTKEKKKTKHVPWVEKYRPRSVDDVAYQDEVVAVLKKSLQGSDLPNLLFYGPPGTGKTSTILAASRELFGDIFKTRVLELNASDERGISVVRDKVKVFSQQSAGAVRPDGKPCPPFKIVILDEADSMTGAAQAALRRTMEKQSKTTRFCLICNYVSRIIEPIASRCAKFRFKPLSEEILFKRIRYICEEEKIAFEEEMLDALLYTSEGDLRKAITFLQSASRLKADEAITKADIYEIAGVVQDDVIDNLLTVCQSNSYEKLQAAVQDMMNEGHAGAQLIMQLHDKLVLTKDLKDLRKAYVMEKLGEVDKCLTDGADEFLQLMALCSTIMQQMNSQSLDPSDKSHDITDKS